MFRLVQNPTFLGGPESGGGGGGGGISCSGADGGGSLESRARRRLALHQPSHVFRTETAQPHAGNPARRQHMKQQ